MADTPAPETNGANPEPVTAAAPAVVFDTSAIERSLADFTTTITDRIGRLEERSRADFTVPGAQPEAPPADRGQWMNVALRILSGERVQDMQIRALADLITSDNPGVVPDAFSQEIIGVIDPRRPFLQSTRRLSTPSSGLKLTMPIIEQRPTVDVQANEKDELDSTATEIGIEDFEAVTIGGAGDISIQLLKRSSPEFLSLYLELLAEAYAIKTEAHALGALLTAIGGSPATLDPENASLGDAWASSFDAMVRPPDTIWMSSAAVGAFIDAKASGTNAPLYSQLQANFTAAGGVGGNVSGLRPVHVPQLNATAADVVVGPSTGFAWAEDGTYTLQVDVPAKAGRDVALVGMLWPAPLYPAAFTVFALGT